MDINDEQTDEFLDGLCNETKVTGRGVGSGCGVTRRRR